MMTLFFSRKIYSYVQSHIKGKEKERRFLLLDGMFHMILFLLVLLAIMVCLKMVTVRNVVISVVISTVTGIILALCDRKILFKE